MPGTTGSQANPTVRDPLQEASRSIRVPEQPTFRLAERLAATTFDAVRHQGPWRAAEPKQRHAAVQLGPGQRDRLVDVRQLSVNVDVARQTIEVVRGDDRVREHGADVRAHVDLQAQGLRDHEDVAEYDGGIERDPSERLQGRLAGQRWRATDFCTGNDVSPTFRHQAAARTEERVFGAQVPELGQVPARLPMAPDGRPLHRLAARRPNDQVVAERRERCHLWTAVVAPSQSTACCVAGDKITTATTTRRDRAASWPLRLMAGTGARDPGSREGSLRVGGRY